ncbi:hypothetical protein DFS33DRAFT_1358885 [Desarmillaria ectypa]|nr:hypothetical protein DFS33DRAFT_1358885 [Desarmillaria ectypa]
MLLQFILLFFHFATSASFTIDPVKGNATVGIPLTLTWRIQQGDPEEFHFELRNSTQQPGKGDPIPSTSPGNGIPNGIVTIYFLSPGEYTIEVVSGEDDNVLTSQAIYVSNPDSGSNFSHTMSSVSWDIIGTDASMTAKSVERTSFNSPSISWSGESSTQSPFHATESSLIVGITATTMTTTTANATKATQSASQTTSERSISTSSNSNKNSVSSAIGSRSKIHRIVGATVGSFVFLLLLLGALVYTLYQRQNRKKCPAIFHRDMMVRKRSLKVSFSPLTPTAKDSDTYTNFAHAEKRASYSSIEREDPAPGRQLQKEGWEYSLPAPLGNRSETPSPVHAHTDQQMELHDVLVKHKTELIRLKTELRRGGDVQADIEALKARITGLEEALKSPWALGYTDDMPDEVSRVLASL